MNKKDKSCVFLQDLPWPMQLPDLVQFLEVEYKTAVHQASIEYQHPNDCCNAYVEVSYRENGLKIRHRDIIMYSGREIYALADRTFPEKGLLHDGDPTLFFMKSKEIATNAVACVIEECSSSGFDKIASDAVKVTEEREGDQHTIDKISSVVYGEVTSDATIDGNVDYCCSEGDVTGINVKDAIVQDNAIIEDANLELVQSIEELNICCHGMVETRTTKLAIFQKELNEAIEAKDFKKAAAIQADIENLEDNDVSSGDHDLIVLLQSELDQELHQIVKAKDFAKAAIIQGHIEALEKGTLSAEEVKSLLMEDFNTDLGKAIKAKDFVTAGTIQNRIEGLKQGRKT